jgi:outer membrane protein assembly factor BamA
MRSRLTQIVALATTCLLAGKVSFHAQSTDSAVVVTCPALSTLDDHQPDEQRPSRPEISIASVKFSGALQIPISDQDMIVSSIKLQTHGNSVHGLTDEALERVRAGWQDRGYFKVQVSGKAKTLTNSNGRRIAIEVRVDGGMQYRLGGIMFKNNKAISDVAGLRGLFPIKDGDIFSREKIAAGLENLRRSYGELGYINFTAIPDTVFDDTRGMISLEIDVDEDKQFYVSSINIVGLDEHSRREILKDFPAGQVYNEKLFRLFLDKYQSVFKLQPDDPRLTERRLEEETGAVSITLYACPCPVCY